MLKTLPLHFSFGVNFIPLTPTTTRERFHLKINSSAWRGSATDDLDSIFCLTLTAPRHPHTEPRSPRLAVLNLSRKPQLLTTFSSRPIVCASFERDRVHPSDHPFVRPRGLPQPRRGAAGREAFIFFSVLLAFTSSICEGRLDLKTREKLATKPGLVDEANKLDLSAANNNRNRVE